MPHVQASLLLHRGHGPLHVDVILGTGGRCQTIRLAATNGRWQATMGLPHRRHYLTFRGPVAGRGSVIQLGRGRAWCARSAVALRLRLSPNLLFLMKMRRVFRASGGLPLALPRDRGEVVVPLGRAATLPRS